MTYISFDSVPVLKMLSHSLRRSSSETSTRILNKRNRILKTFRLILGKLSYQSDKSSFIQK